MTVTDFNGDTAALMFNGAVTDQARALTVTGPGTHAETDADTVITYTVGLSGTAFANPTVVTWTVTHGTTEDADFSAITGTITFPTMMTFDVTVAADMLNEASEDFTVQVSVADATADGGTTYGAAHSTSITDAADDAIEVAIDRVGAANVGEATMANFSVTLSGGVRTADLTVPFDFTGTLDNAEYEITMPTGIGAAATGGTLTFLADGTEMADDTLTVTANLVDDSTTETSETLTITGGSLSAAGTVAYAAGGDTAMVTVDDDEPTTFAISGAPSEAEGGSLTFGVVGSGVAPSGAVTATCTVSGAGVTAGDFSATSGGPASTMFPAPTLAFTTGDYTTSQDCVIHTFDDGTVEGSEDFTVTLTVSGGVAVSPATATGMIEASDQPPPTLSTPVEIIVNGQPTTTLVEGQRFHIRLSATAIPVDGSFSVYLASIANNGAGGTVVLHEGLPSGDSGPTDYPLADGMRTGSSIPNMAFLTAGSPGSAYFTRCRQIGSRFSDGATDCDVPPEITVEADTQPVFSSGASYTPIWTTSLVIDDTLPAASGGNTPVVYSLSPALPAGLTFNQATRQITGTPTTASADTAYTMTVTDFNGDTAALMFNGAVTTQARTLTVTGPGTIAEGTAGVESTAYTVALAGMTFTAATAVTWTVTHGDTADADFVDASDRSGTVMFGTTDTSMTFTLTVAADMLNEASEDFTVQVSVADATADGGTAYGAAHSTTITDAADDAIEVTIARVGMANVNEAATANFSVTLAGGVRTADLTVPFAFTGALDNAEYDITAPAGIPAADTGGTLTFLADGTEMATDTLTVTANLVDDSTTETSETLTITGGSLSTAGTVAYAAGGDTAMVTVDDDELTTFAISGAPSEAEGGSLTFGVVGSGAAPSGAVTATCTVSGAGVTAGDFSATSGGPASATFPAPTLNFTSLNHTTSQDCVIHTFDDMTAEGSEDFTVTLTVSGGVAVSPATATGTIEASDQPAVFAISGAPDEVEGDSLTFSVVGSGPMPSGAVTATCTVSGADVTAGDFSATSGGPVSATFPAPTLNFTMGDYTTAQDCVIHTFDDATSEGAEDFTVTLTVTGAGATVDTANNTATGTIQASDLAVTVGFEQTAFSVDESVVQFDICAVVTDPIQSDPLDIMFSLVVSTFTTPGVHTAEAADFTGISNQVVGPFSNPRRRDCFSVEISEDTIHEGHAGNETFGLMLGPSPGSSAVFSNHMITLSPTEVVVDIVDNDPASVFDISGTPSAAEGGSLTFSVVGSGSTPSGAVTATCTVSGAGVTAGDFSDTSGGAASLSFPAPTLTFTSANHTTAQDCVIHTLDDMTAEGAEDFTVTLTVAGAGAAVGTDMATGTIQASDQPPTFAISGTPSAAEGGSLTFGVVGSGAAPSGAVTATCTVSGAGVTAGDFRDSSSATMASTTFPAPTLTFTSLDYTTSQDCVVHTYDDMTAEGAEDFTVTLTVSVGAMVDTASNTATGTIQASDQPATFAISGTPSAAEGGSLTFPVVGSGGMPSGAVTATCTVSGAGVTAGDFSATSGGPVSATFPAPTLTFTSANYTTSQDCVVHTFDDMTAEGAEDFTVTLTVSVGAMVDTASNTATGTIQISDQPATFAISGTPSAAEGGSLTFGVVGSGGAPSGAVTATCTVSGAGVTAGDFSDTSGGPVSATFPAPTLTFTSANHTTSQDCVIHTFDDMTAEGAEDFTVTLTVMSGGAMVDTASNTATGTIQASDQPVFAISGAPDEAEGDSLTFSVVGSGGMPSGAVTATCTVMGADVTAGDFRDSSSATSASMSFPAPPLTFAPGNYTTAQDCVIHTFDDATSEEAEDFTVTLTVTGGGAMVDTANNTATGTIQASDLAVTIGFEQTVFSVDESIIQFDICTVVTDPIQSESLDIMFSLVVSTFTTPGVHTAEAADFTGISNQVVGPFSNLRRRDCFSVEISRDTIHEGHAGNETFGLMLGPSPGSSAVFSNHMITLSPIEVAVAIIDNDPASVFDISGTPSAAEGGSLTFSVVGSGSTPSGAVTATCTVSGAGVTAGDFSDTSGGAASVSFPAPTLTFTSANHTTAQDCVIHTLDDMTAEGAEDFTVTLTVAGAGAAVGTDMATGTIQASDQPPTFAISGTPSAAEGGSLTFGVVGSGGAPSGAVTATCTVSGAGVTAGDFSATSGATMASTTFPAPTLTFTSLDYTTSQDCVVHTFDDTMAEGAEDFTVTLTVMSGSAMVDAASNTATGTIQTSDQSVFAISGTPSAAEGGSLTFGVVGSGDAPGSAVTATCTVTGTGPVMAGDFSDMSGGSASAAFPAPTLTFTSSNHTTSQDCVIHTYDDTMVEGDEDFTVTLTVSAGATVSTAMATGTIQTSDQSVFAISGTPMVVEGGSLTFGVVGSGDAPGSAVTATCTVSGAGVTAGDFSDTSGGSASTSFPAPTLTFTSSNHTTSQDCVIHTYDDMTVEGDEDFTVTLTVTVGATVSTATATGTIQQPATFSISGMPTAAESGSLTFSVVGSGAAPSGAVTATCTVGGTGVTAGDFRDTPGGPASASFPAPTLTFTPLDYTMSQDCVIHTYNDMNSEGDEDFTVTLTVTGGNAMADTASNTATGTIQASDQPAIFTISGTPSAAEGGSLTFGVVGSGAAPIIAVTATCTVGGTGVTAGDFSDTSGGGASASFPAPTLNFTPANYTMSQDCVIHTYDDMTAEGAEDFTVTLTVSGGATVSTAMATGTIQISDQPATFSISGTPSAAEGGSLTFGVVGSGPAPSGAVTATCTVSGAGVTAGDFSDTSGGAASVSFPAPTLTFTSSNHTTSQDCVVHTYDDTMAEGAEDFTVTLTVSVGATVSMAMATGTIQTSDQSVFAISGTPSAAEGGSLTFGVVGSGDAPSGAVTATCTVGGAGVMANDFSDTSGGPVSSTFPAPTLTFTPTNYTTSQDCLIHTYDDTMAEGAEDFTVTLTVTTGVVSTATATGTIEVSDQPVFAISGTPSAAEGGSLTFGVVGSGDAPSGAVTATCTVGGAGVTANDFSDTSGGSASSTFPAPTLTFTSSNHTTSQDCVIHTFDDMTAEGAEDFTVTLTVTTGAVSTATATGTIEASDQPVFAISGTPSAAEGGSLTFGVVGSGDAPSGAVTATCTVGGAGVTAGDFSDTSGGSASVSFPAPTLTFTSSNHTTSQDCVVHTFDDMTAEGAEDFTVTLTVSGGAAVSTATATGTIEASDQPVFAISGTPSAAEGGSLTFGVVGSGDAPSGAVTATCTVGGAGVMANDFSDTSGGPVSSTFPAPTLTFTPTNYTTSQDCVVHTFDDMTAEGAEDFTVTLTVSVGAAVSTATATGTIEASDQSVMMSGATAERTARVERAAVALNRTTAALSVPVIAHRFDPGRGLSGPGLALNLGGKQVLSPSDGSAAGNAPATPPPAVGDATGRPPVAGGAAEVPATLNLGGLAELAAEQLQGLGSSSPNAESRTLQQLLGNSGFSATSERGGGNTLSVWGRSSYTSLSGEPEEGGNRYDYDGDSYAFYLGLDGRYGDHLAGVALGYTVGDLELRTAGAAAGDRSDFESDLVAVYPYASWQPSDRLSVWLLAGYGQGELEIEERRGTDVGKATSDTDLWLGAAGLSWRRPVADVDVLLRLSGTALHGETDGGTLRFGGAMPRNETYGETETDAQQLRAEAELGQVFGFEDGGRLRPYLTAGVSYDFGDGSRDAATSEFGTGLQLHWPRLGLETELEIQARLSSKDDRDYREYTGTGMLRYDLGGDRRGLQLALRPAFGLARGAGLDGLDTAVAPLDGGAFGAAPSSLQGGGAGSGLGLHSELSYGIGNVRVLRGLPGLLTLYGSGGLSAGAGRDLYRSGVRFEAARFTLGAGLQHESGSASDSEFLLDGTFRF